MNDFTKEELRIIWLSLADYSYPGIKDKIQSLIDNYCEHEHSTQDLETLCFFRCDKCKELIE